MNIIDGKALSLEIKETIRQRIAGLTAERKRKPCLAMILVGSNPASRSYLRGKGNAAAFTGMDSRLVELPETAGNAELLQEIARLNADDGVDGILVQLPLPSHIDENLVLDAILPSKDVDGFHPINVAGLWMGRPCFVPCTPQGIIHMIESTGQPIEGKRAVVVGRSKIVGRPVSKLLLDRNATVTTAHSRTADLGAVTRDADILVVATGHAGLITADMVKPGAIVIDVGINRTEDGRLTGDVDFDSVSQAAGWISPVPGGVGPMTIAYLIKNTLRAYELSAEGR